MNAPTLGRIVHVTTDVGLVPAIVTHAGDVGAGLHLVAFSHEWPLTAARVLRNVPALAGLPEGAVFEAAWSWPAPAVGLGPVAASQWFAGLELEQRALARSLSRCVERLDSFSARLNDLAERVDALERRRIAL